MKKTILSILVLIVGTSTYAQSDYKKPASLAVHFFLNDFQTAADIRSQGLGNVVRDKQWVRTRRMIPGVALSYIKGLSNKIDLAVTASGCFGEYPVPNKLVVNAEKFMIDVAATANLKLLSDKYYINPFITGGLGASSYKRYFSAFIPIGVGMQIKIVDDIYFMANSQYRIAVTENGAYHLYHSFGIAAPIKKRG